MTKPVLDRFQSPDSESFQTSQLKNAGNQRSNSNGDTQEYLTGCYAHKICIMENQADIWSKSQRIVRTWIAFLLLVSNSGCSRTVLTESFNFPEEKDDSVPNYKVFLSLEGAVGRQYTDLTDKRIGLTFTMMGQTNELIQRNYTVYGRQVSPVVDWEKKNGLLTGFRVRFRDLLSSQPGQSVMTVSFKNHEGLWLEVTKTPEPPK